MIWTTRRIIGLIVTLLGTFAVIGMGLYYAWNVSQSWAGMQGMSFLTFAVIFSLVLLTMGMVMAFYIVMIIAKNEDKD